MHPYQFSTTNCTCRHTKPHYQLGNGKATTRLLTVELGILWLILGLIAHLYLSSVKRFHPPTTPQLLGWQWRMQGIGWVLQEVRVRRKGQSFSRLAYPRYRRMEWFLQRSLAKSWFVWQHDSKFCLDRLPGIFRPTTLLSAYTVPDDTQVLVI